MFVFTSMKKKYKKNTNIVVVFGHSPLCFTSTSNVIAFCIFISKSIVFAFVFVVFCVFVFLCRVINRPWLVVPVTLLQFHIYLAAVLD